MKKNEKPEVEVSEEEKVLSLKRIGIFFVFSLFMIFGLLFAANYLLKSFTNTVKNLSKSSNSNIPEHVKLPNVEDFNMLLNDLVDFVHSNPVNDLSVLSKLFDYLHNMQTTGLGLESIICEYLCR